MTVVANVDVEPAFETCCLPAVLPKISIYSFGREYPNGEKAFNGKVKARPETRPPTCMLTIDASNWRDPAGAHDANGVPLFPNMNGYMGTVQSFVMEDPRFKGLMDVLILQIADLLSGSNRPDIVSVGFVDQRGTQISPALACLLGEEIKARQLKVPFTIRHYAWMAESEKV